MRWAGRVIDKFHDSLTFNEHLGRWKRLEAAAQVRAGWKANEGFRLARLIY